MKNKLSIFLLVVMSSVLLAACGSNGNDAAQDETSQNEENPNAQAQVEEVDPEKVVAKVNGEEIKGQDYNSAMQQTQMRMAQLGQTDPEAMKEQTLNMLIDQKLLSQEVAEKGYEASEEEVENYLDEMKAEYGGEEQFKEALESSPITMDTLKVQIADELALQKYLENEMPESEVSDEQVKEYYEEAKAQSEAQQGEEETEEESKFPELAEVEDQIRSQLQQQQVQDKLIAIVEEKKENSEIEKMI